MLRLSGLAGRCKSVYASLGKRWRKNDACLILHKDERNHLLIFSMNYFQQHAGGAARLAGMCRFKNTTAQSELLAFIQFYPS